MADKKVRKGLDALRGDIQELAESFAAFRAQVSAQQAAAAAEHQKRSIAGQAGTSNTGPLEMRGVESGSQGYVGSFGYYQPVSGNGEAHFYCWSLEEHPVEDILAFPIDEYAQVLAAIGHKQRLGILLMILAKPATANDVVSELSLGTTGAAYHHLNVLQAAGLVEQQRRGVFTIVLAKVPALLTILASLSGAIAVDISSPDASSKPTDTSAANEPSANGVEHDQ
jgi:DNA-binding transcriptional ArsR family regulator